MKNLVHNNVTNINKGVVSGDVKPLTSEELKRLPDPVKKYIDFTGFAKLGHINCLRLRQEGMFRSSLRSGWMPFTAEQYFNVNSFSFIWYARMRGPLGLKFHAVDQYLNGEGNMNVNLANLFNITDARGPEINQGELVRYLAEMMWFPSEFTSKNIKWDEIDDLSAKATLTLNNDSAIGIFNFEKDGSLANFTAKRYKAGGKYYFLEDWYTPVLNFSKFGEVLLPSDMDVIWKLNIGELTYAKLRIKSLEFNNPDIY